MAMEKHFIQEGMIRAGIESYLRSELNRAGYSGINIQKTHLATRIVLYVEKPPIVIGKKGRRINKLTKVLKEEYGIDNPVIDVQRIENPTLDSNIVARRIAVALERGMNRRRIIYKALRAVMSSGARGVEIILSGKIVGKGGRSRTEKYLQGYMKKAGDPLKLVRFGETQAYLKAGVIGVTVKIVPPDAIFPDQISLISDEPEIVVEVIEEAPLIEGGKIKSGKAGEEKPAGKKTAKKPKKEAESKKDEEPEKKAKKGEKPVKEKAPVEEKAGKTVKKAAKKEEGKDVKKAVEKTASKMKADPKEEKPAKTTKRKASSKKKEEKEEPVKKDKKTK